MLHCPYCNSALTNDVARVLPQPEAVTENHYFPLVNEMAFELGRHGPLSIGEASALFPGSDPVTVRGVLRRGERRHMFVRDGDGRWLAGSSPRRRSRATPKA